MNKHFKQRFSENIKFDFPASIVVTLVAIPLCLGIALASGAPLFAGIIAGMVGGIIVTLISGSALGVSGPAAGLAVIVLSSIDALGSFEALLVAVMFAGVVQVLLGVLKAGVIGHYFPSSVIKGMLSGIGVVIILKQIPHAFGYSSDPEGDFEFFQRDGYNTFSELGRMFDLISFGPLLISVISLIILIIWEQPFLKRYKFSQLIQGPLIVVAVGIGLNILFKDSTEFTLVNDQLVRIPIADSLTDFFGQFTRPDFGQLNRPEVYMLGLTIAVVASLETLLCLEATDKLDPYKRVTPANRELMAQGIGNIVSGFLGGLPITQVIVRSSANIQSGGRTWVSAFLHGVFILLCVLFFPGLLNLIPIASLAAILLVVGYKLSSISIYKGMYKAGRAEFIPYMVTILGIVFTDLLMGIGLGLMVAFVNILFNNYRTGHYFQVDENIEERVIRIRFAEVVSFLNKASILKSLDEVPDNHRLIIDAKHTMRIHPDIIEIIESFKQKASARKISIEWIGANDLLTKKSSWRINRRILKETIPN